MTNYLPQTNIKTALIVIFSLITILVIGMTGLLFWQQKRTLRFIAIESAIANAKFYINKASNLEKDFFLYETINSDFYHLRESEIAQENNNLLDSVNFFLEQLREFEEVSESETLLVKVNDVANQVNKQEELFNQLVLLTLEKGFKDWGVIGRMRNHIHAIENNSLPIDMTDMLMARRHEKDYLLRKQDEYSVKLSKAVATLKKNIEQLPKSPMQKQLLRDLEGYKSAFMEMVALERKIGYTKNEGIKNELFEVNQTLLALFLDFESDMNFRIEALRKRLLIIIASLSAISIILTLFAGWFVNRKLGKPIVALSNSIKEGVTSNFIAPLSFKSTQLSDEIGEISQDVAFMYERVQQYIAELVTQREEIMAQSKHLSAANTKLEENTEYIEAKNAELETQNQKVSEQKEKLEENYYNLQMLTYVGQQIILNLNIEDIVHVVYNNLRSILDVSTFAIGVYKEKGKALDFYGAEGNTKIISRDEEKITQEGSLSVISFTKSQEIIIGDIDDEYKKYTPVKPSKRIFKNCRSCIYIPLTVKQKAIGVISVQSEQNHAYDDFGVNIFRNIAAYTAIALENAQSYEKISLQQFQLTQQAERLSEANLEISIKNKALTDSINYAKRIQSTILPKISDIKHQFPESFILFKPRDIVSGDFYFFSTLPRLDGKGGNIVVMSAADCTGHGVPGAFTSMVGHGLLNTVINKKGMVKPASVLKQVNIGIQQTFRQRETDNRDGMDIALTVLDTYEKVLHFAGAKSHLVYVQDNELYLIKGDKHSVGGLGLSKQSDTTVNYTPHSIAVDKPTTVYLFSDGFQDQFGGKRGRKLTSRKFRELLLSIQDKSMEEQKIFLEDYLQGWMIQSDEKQVDDIMVIGFKITP